VCLGVPCSISTPVSLFAKLVDMHGNLCIEISLGSILDFANDIVAESDVRTKLNLPVSFEEVFSLMYENVPD